MGLLSAFMCALANGIYANPPEDPVCRGAAAVNQMTIVEWVSMGCFFLVIILTVILAADMDGVPDDLLFRHLHANRWLYTAPPTFGVRRAVPPRVRVRNRPGRARGVPRVPVRRARRAVFPATHLLRLEVRRRARGKNRASASAPPASATPSSPPGRSPRDRAARGGTRGTKPRAVRSLLRERRGISYRSIGILVIPYHSLMIESLSSTFEGISRRNRFFFFFFAARAARDDARRFDRRRIHVSLASPRRRL